MNMATINYKDYNNYKIITNKYASSDDWGKNYKICYDYGTSSDTSSICIQWNDYNTTTAATTFTWGDCYTSWKYDRLTPSRPVSPEIKLKRIIASRQAPAVHVRERWRLHRSKQQCPDEREARARQTLRRVIGDDKFKSFLTNGFVTVRNPKSGLSFQIFPGHGITCVFDKGEMVERLCVVLKGDFPPTDSIIMRYLMILNNEEQFRSIAVKWDVQQREKKIVTPDERSLMEIFKELKEAA